MKTEVREIGGTRSYMTSKYVVVSFDTADVDIAYVRMAEVEVQRNWGSITVRDPRRCQDPNVGDSVATRRLLEARAVGKLNATGILQVAQIKEGSYWAIYT